MKRTFLNHEKALLTTMVQADNPARIKELIDKSVPEGAEAFGMQFEKMKPEHRKSEVYKELFTYTDKPIYVTNYLTFENENKTYDELAEEMLELAECGATLCDIMGDYYDKQPDELAKDEGAIKKQMELIEKLHKKGVEVLLSSHVLKFIPAERVLEIAKEHERRGADICKIVTGADTMEEQIENLRIVNLLKENLNIPFLFLSSGECQILRRIGGELGCSMYLCVHEHDEFATDVQPLLKNVKAIRDNM
ncbi:MAG: type I 3-dehydroquinate dehydratase [Clostridia bacterium]|nr:type I 3-dehydroquinate dehydratase [Clostridia bacterium]